MKWELADRGEQGDDAVGASLCAVHSGGSGSQPLVIRPGWDVEGGTEAEYNMDGHCFYDTDDGDRLPGWLT